MATFQAGDMVRQVHNGHGTSVQDNGKVARVLEVQSDGYELGGNAEGLRIDDDEFLFKQEWRGTAGFELVSRGDMSIEEHNKSITKRAQENYITRNVLFDETLGDI